MKVLNKIPKDVLYAIIYSMLKDSPDKRVIIPKQEMLKPYELGIVLYLSDTNLLVALQSKEDLKRSDGYVDVCGN